MNLPHDNDAPDLPATERSEHQPSSISTRGEHRVPMIPDHQLIRCIGQGSYGEVWLARNVLGDYRAVKIVYRRTFESERPFNREFEGIKKFEPISRSHESQVQILHVGRAADDSSFYYIMELADDSNAECGTRSAELSDQSPESIPHFALRTPHSYSPRTLRSEIRRCGRLPFEDCLEIALKLARAVGHLHQHGLVHRDIKPSNIIFVNGIPKLADIGLVAKSDATLSFVGTEGFLPPEGPGKPPADLYSLGKVLYEMSTGRDRQDFPELPTDLRAVAERERLVEFNEIVLKACEPRLDRRYESADQMHADLVLLQAGKSLKRSRLLERRLATFTRLSAVGVIVTALVATAYFYQQHQTRRATRLAEENKQLAKAESRQRDRAEFQRIEQMLETGKSSQALALLAHRVREHPNDELAARRLLSALTYRNFALPIAELDHDAPLAFADVSPDGRYLATGTDNGTLSLWNATNGQLRMRVQAGGKNWGLRFSPNGKRVVTGSQDGLARVWDLTAEPRLVFELKHPAEVLAPDFSPDGKWIATVSFDGRARIWNAQTGAESFSLQHNNPQLFAVRFSPDGRRIVTSTWNNSNIYVWDFASRRLDNTLNDPRYLHGITAGWDTAFQFDPVGPRLVYSGGGRPAHLRIWNYATGEVLESKEAHDWPITAAFSPDGRRAASVSNDQTLRIWNAENGQPASAKLLHGGGLRYVAFSPNGQLIATASEDFTIQLWDPATGARLSEPLQHPASVQFLRFSPDGKKLFSCTLNKARIWDILPGEARPNILPHESGEDARDVVAFVQFDPTGDRLLTALNLTTGGGTWENWSRRVGVLPPYSRMWDARSGEPRTPKLEMYGIRGYEARLNSDGSQVISAASDGFATVWNAKDGSVQRQLRGNGAAGHVNFSPDSRQAVVSEATRAVIWDLADQRVIHTLECEDEISSTEFSSDGKKLLTTTASWTGKNWGSVWEANSGQRLVSIQSRSEVSFGVFSPDGRSVLFPDEDRCRIYDAQDGKPLTDWMKHDGAVLSARFSRDGKRVVTCSFDQTARVWDTRTGQLLIPNLNHQWLVPTADFSPKADEIATGSWDKTARIWDLAFGSAPSEPFRHDDWVVSLAYHPDGNWLATGCADGNARIWEVMQAPGLVPAWLVGLAESMAGYRVNPLGNLERTSGYKELVELREKLHGTFNEASIGERTALSARIQASRLADMAVRAPDDDYYERWARWFFGDRETRPVSPGASATMRTYRARRVAEDSIFSGLSLEEALRYVPMDPPLLARLGRKLVVPPTRDAVINPDRPDWFTRLALKLAPDLPMAWLARAEVLDAAKKFPEAEKALEKTMELNPKDPNAWHAQALLLQHTGREGAAYLSYKRALDLVTVESSRSSFSDRPYLNETLKAAMARRLAPYDLWHSWAQSLRHGRNATERARLEADWESALALEQASPDQRDAMWRMRLAVVESLGGRRSVIVRQPETRRVAVGERATFAVELTSVEPLLIQWQHDGLSIAGATNRTLNIDSATPANAGQYTAFVRELAASTKLVDLSQPAGLEVVAGQFIHGALKREIFRDVHGWHLSDLTNHPKFPDRPDEVNRVNAWEQPPFMEQKTGVRLTGYLLPKVSGKHVFYLCADEQGALFLSEDDSAERKRQIAFEPVWSWERNWTGLERRGTRQNISLEIHLEAGKRYYVESLVLNSSVSGNLGVAWQMPGQPPPQNGSPPIGGQYLALRADTVPPAAIQPARAATVESRP